MIQYDIIITQVAGLGTMRTKEFLEFIEGIYDVPTAKRVLLQNRLHMEMRQNLIPEESIELIAQDWRRNIKKMEDGLEKYKHWQKNKDFLQDFNPEYRCYLDEWDAKIGTPKLEEFREIIPRLSETMQKRMFPMHNGRLTVRILSFLRYWEKKLAKAKASVKK